MALQDGDVVVIDVEARRVDLELDDDEIVHRMATWREPDPSSKVPPGSVRDKYVRLVSSAHLGCVL